MSDLITTSATGTIFDQDNKPLDGVTIQMFLLPVMSALTEPHLLPTNLFEAYTNQDPEKVLVVFTKSGYKPQSIKMSDLEMILELTMYKGIEIAPWMVIAVIAAVAVYRKKSGKIGKLESGDVKTIAFLVGGIIAFSIIQKILVLLGLWKSKDTGDLDAASTDPNSFWNPNYWQNINPAGTNWTYAITEQTAREWCAELYNSFGAFNDCEECAIAVFKRCKTKANASFLAWTFQKYYGQDLLTFLRGGIWPQDRLSDADVNTINTYINRLPKF